MHRLSDQPCPAHCPEGGYGPPAGQQASLGHMAKVPIVREVRLREREPGCLVTSWGHHGSPGCCPRTLWLWEKSSPHVGKPGDARFYVHPWLTAVAHPRARRGASILEN